jgi:hypothetical protein
MDGEGNGRCVYQHVDRRTDEDREEITDIRRNCVFDYYLDEFHPSEAEDAKCVHSIASLNAKAFTRTLSHMKYASTGNFGSVFCLQFSLPYYIEEPVMLRILG